MNKATTKKSEATVERAQRDPLADAFRRWGYLQADLDPMGRLERQFHPDIAEQLDGASPAEVGRWKSVYCARAGFEFMHVVDRERVDWMRDTIEAGPPPVDRE